MHKSFVEFSNLAYMESALHYYGGPLTFDDNYRLAHLPLVSPTSALVIARREGSDYEYGKYENPRVGLVIPVSHADLAASPIYQAMESEFRSLRAWRKVDSPTMTRRLDRLHVTVASGLDYNKSLALRGDLVEFLRRHYGGISIRLAGPFIGRKNSGRIYLPALSEVVGGEDSLAELQSRVGVVPTRFYALGLYQLREELNTAEASQFINFVNEWQGTIVFEGPIKCIQLWSTNDDLALSRRVLWSAKVDE